METWLTEVAFQNAMQEIAADTSNAARSFRLASEKMKELADAKRKAAKERAAQEAKEAKTPRGAKAKGHEVKRDRWGRYILPDPETGEERPWTRATTLASTIEDRWNLERWAKRHVAKGVALRPDLYALARALPLTEKRRFDEIAEKALEAAAAGEAANLGTAAHAFVEQLARGENPFIPPPFDRDIEAYQQMMERVGLRPVEGWTERIVLVPGLGVAGTFDMLVEADWLELPRIADLKTGKDVAAFGGPTYAIQLSLYGNATHFVDPVTNRLGEMPEIDREYGYIIHMPVGQGKCWLYEVDLVRGWSGAQLARDVRDYRSQKDLLQDVTFGGGGE